MLSWQEPKTKVVDPQDQTPLACCLYSGGTTGVSTAVWCGGTNNPPYYECSRGMYLMPRTKICRVISVGFGPIN